jgi:glycosyltransferase involved in cell wall biosynthesis
MTTALVISRYFPFSAERVFGLYQRLGTQVQALAKVADRVECLFLVPVGEPCDPEFVREQEERLRQLWSVPVSVRFSPSVTEEVPKGRWRRIGKGIFQFHAQLIARSVHTAATLSAVNAALDGRPDMVMAHRLVSMSVLMRVAQLTPERLQGVPVFFDLDDIEHISLYRRLRHDPAWPGERLLLLQLPRLLLAEIQATRLSAATFVCSEMDRNYLSRIARTNRVQLVPNSVSFPLLAAGDATEPLVVFVGAMGYRPNAQAVDSLVRDIWPAVRARVPAARLAIVGPGPERTVSYGRADDSVTFTGFVADLEPWYRRARVVCCPIYHGGGTRVKIIEAAAYAKAIVSTRIGAEGLTFENGREILLHDSRAEIARACVRLLEDPAGAARLGRAALAKARATYDRNAVINELASIFRAGQACAIRQRVPA